LNRLPVLLALLVLSGSMLAQWPALEAQPAQASSLAKRTSTPTHTPAPTLAPTATPTASGTATPTPVPGPNGVWNIVSSPNTGWPNNYLYGVAGVASNDVWAVGTYGTLGTNDWQVIQHWNGTSWSSAATPSLSTPNELSAVTAIA